MSESQPQRIILIGIDLPYWDLVAFLFKLLFASLPVWFLVWMIRVGLSR